MAEKEVVAVAAKEKIDVKEVASEMDFSNALKNGFINPLIIKFDIKKAKAGKIKEFGDCLVGKEGTLFYHKGEKDFKLS